MDRRAVLSAIGAIPLVALPALAASPSTEQESPRLLELADGLPPRRYARARGSGAKERRG